MAEAPLFSIHGLQVDSIRAGVRKRLLDGVDLAVQSGEIYGVVGESGSGKSLAMMSSVGLAAPGLVIAGGSVRFGERDAPASAQQALRQNLAHGVSLLFQNAKGALNPFLRIERQILRVLKLQDVAAKQRRQRAHELLAAVGLEPYEIAPKYAHELSGGQAQRVAMACALATQPRLLIADEPTTALDVTTEREVLRFLMGLCRKYDLAVILVSHNLALVSQYCSRVSVLHAGHVVESGAAANVFSSPLHPYTKGLLAAIPDVDAPRDLVPLVGSVWGGGFSTDRCRFSHRCAQVQASCVGTAPGWSTFGDHAVRCVLHAKDAP